MYQSSTFNSKAESLREQNLLVNAIREGNFRLFGILSKHSNYQDLLQRHGQYLVEEARRFYQPNMVSELLKIDAVRESLNTMRVEPIIYLSECQKSNGATALPSSHCPKLGFF